MSKPFRSTRHFPARSLAGVALLAVVVLAAAALIAGKGIAERTVAGKTPWPRSLAAQTNPANIPAITATTRARINARYAALPLAFESNQGQFDPRVKYLARGNGYTLFLTANDAVISLYSSAQHVEPTEAGSFNARTANKSRSSTAQKLSTSVMRMHLVNGNSPTNIAASDRLPGRINYYIGNDPSKWQTDVGQYSRISYENVYAGVNMAFHGAQHQMEFDFIVAPGANSAPIELGFSGARKITTDDFGNLILSSAAADLTLHRPVAYQRQNGMRQPVDARFVVKANNEVGFALGSYDRTRELVIDPVLTYATYLGGSAEDEAFAIAVDSSGNAYVAGQTASPNFPAPGGTIGTSGGFDAFVTKLNATGTAPLDFTTIIGGSGNDSALGIAVNSTGTYVVGNAGTGFASTVTIGPTGGQDVFVAKLNSTTGVTPYVTKIGGTGTESGNGIAVDSSGNAYIAGQTDSTDFPGTSSSPIQSANAGTIDGFVAELNATGTALTFSTYLGGSNDDLVTGIALDGSNNAYVTGITNSSNFPTTMGAFQTTQPGVENGFVTAIKSDGSALNYSTYLGGSGTDDALGIAVDSAGEAYVTGDTNSPNFPTVNPQSSFNGATDVFVSKLTSDGSALLFSTYFGGMLDDAGTGIALDSFGDAYVTGRTTSSNYQTTVETAFQPLIYGSPSAFVTEFSNTGFVVYSSYFGGNLSQNTLPVTPTPIGAIAVDSSSNAYLAGNTTSNIGLASAGAVQSNFGGGLADGFVAKVGPAPADFSVAISPASISTTSGTTTATITVTVSSVNAAFGSAVTLSCGNKPSKAACNFSTTSVTPGATPGTSNLTISTNGSTGNGMLTPPMNGSSQIFYAFFLPLGGLAFIGAGFGSRKNALFGSLCLLLILTGALVLPACGGGGSSPPPPPPNNNTPPGSYNITVTGTSGGTAHSAQLALTVN